MINPSLISKQQLIMNKPKILLKSPKKLYLLSNITTNPNKIKYSHYKDLKDHFRNISVDKITKPKHSQIIYSNNPYEDITSDDIPNIIQRLNDTPDKLYQAIKIKKNTDVKYKLLYQNKDNQENIDHHVSRLPHSKSFNSISQKSKTKNFTKTLNMFSKIQINKQKLQILKQKIKQKRIKYQQQYKSIFQNKKQLQITTDLPKIGRIRQDSVLKKYFTIGTINKSTKFIR